MKPTDIVAICAGAAAGGSQSAELENALIGAAAAIAVYLVRTILDCAKKKFDIPKDNENDRKNP